MKKLVFIIFCKCVNALQLNTYKNKIPVTQLSAVSVSGKPSTQCISPRCGRPERRDPDVSAGQGVFTEQGHGPRRRGWTAW